MSTGTCAHAPDQEAAARLRVYIAAPLELREDARTLRDALEDSQQIEVTASWITLERQDSDALARVCLADIDRSDIVLALNPLRWQRDGTGGRHVEFGYALARQLPIVMIGARTNLFHFLRRVRFLDLEPTLDEVLAALHAAKAEGIPC